MYKIASLALILVLVSNAVSENKPNTLSASERLNNKKVWVFLLAGQSNMAGRGRITSTSNSDLPDNVYSLDLNLNVISAKHPVHWDHYVAGYSMAISFSEQISKQCNGCSVLLVPAASSGTSINDWQPGGSMLSLVKERLKIAAQYGEIKGILWHQGESDARTDRTISLKKYPDSLKKTIAALRALAGDESVPFIAGTLPEYLSENKKYRFYQDVNSSIAMAIASTKNAHLVDLSDMVAKKDGLHFSSESLDVMAKRYSQFFTHNNDVKNE